MVLVNIRNQIVVKYLFHESVILNCEFCVNFTDIELNTRTITCVVHGAGKKYMSCSSILFVVSLLVICGRDLCCSENRSFIYFCSLVCTILIYFVDSYTHGSTYDDNSNMIYTIINPLL